MWAAFEAKDTERMTGIKDERIKLASEGCTPKLASVCIQIFHFHSSLILHRVKFMEECSSVTVNTNFAGLFSVHII